MLTYDDALNLNYYKKTSFTGWMGGMRFMIKMEKDTIDEQEIPMFHVWIWPGPYIFDLTPDDRKTEKTFPFSNDGKKEAVDWINKQYEARMSEWPRLRTGD